MSYGNIPPVPIEPSDEPTEETKLELAKYTPTERYIVLYERTISEVTQSRDKFEKKVAFLEGKLAADQPFQILLEELRGKYCESTVQHFVTTVVTGVGALGMAVFDKHSNAIPYWCSVTVAAFAVVLGLAVKPLSWLARIWHHRKKK
jgi:hypothetical protein